MRRVLGLTLALIGLAASAAPAFADFGAIALDQHNCAFGRSWHLDNPERARSVALSECGHPGCRVVLEVGPRLCGAVAITPDCHGAGWAARPTREAAQLAAMEQCQHYNAGQCSPRIVDCNR